MANVVSSCLKCTSEKLYYDGSVVLSKTTTAKSNHKSTAYTAGSASVYIPSYTYS
ncbi:MAG: hypothetical protein IJH65_03370 [Methanobrevibacter sp.]|nr:hypothetical protein [Methanobrevibacter sp.]